MLVLTWHSFSYTHFQSLCLIIHLWQATIRHFYKYDGQLLCVSQTHHFRPTFYQRMILVALPWVSSQCYRYHYHPSRHSTMCRRRLYFFHFFSLNFLTWHQLDILRCRSLSSSLTSSKLHLNRRLRRCQTRSSSISWHAKNLFFVSTTDA